MSIQFWILYCNPKIFSISNGLGSLGSSGMVGGILSGFLGEKRASVKAILPLHTKVNTKISKD